MKQLKSMICELCGSNEFIKDEGFFVCQHCNTKYTTEEAKEIVSKSQSENSSHQKPSDHKNWTQFKYWMRRGHSEEEAKRIVSEKQKTFTKEKCIEKYGKERGLEIWSNRQKKWQKTLHESQNLHVGYSKVSQELFKLILEKYEKGQKDYVFFGEHNHEYSLIENKKLYIYDFTDLNKRKIIEFNGDIYHGNPSMFGKEDKPKYSSNIIVSFRIINTAAPGSFSGNNFLRIDFNIILLISIWRNLNE